MREARREKACRQRAVFIHRKKGSSRGATGEGRTVNFDMTRVSLIGWDFVLHKTGLIIPDTTNNSRSNNKRASSIEH